MNDTTHAIPQTPSTAVTQAEVDVLVAEALNNRRAVKPRQLWVAILVVTGLMLSVTFGSRAILASGSCPQTLGPLKNFCAGQPAFAKDINHNFKTLKDYYEATIGKMEAKTLTSGGAFKGDGGNITKLDGKAIVPGTLPLSALTSETQQRLVPTGVILPFGGTKAPPGFLIADGKGYSKSSAPALYAVVGCAFGCYSGSFRVPDVRGVFLRGWNNKRPAASGDPDAILRTNAYPGGNKGDKIGSFQFDMLKKHSHTYKLDSVTTGDDGSNKPYERFAPQDTKTSSTGGVETRPKNVYVNYIIKY